MRPPTIDTSHRRQSVQGGAVLWKSEDNLAKSRSTPHKSKRPETVGRSFSQRLQKFSLSRTPTRSDVVTTNTISKDYDPTTGNKMINHYMILQEIGRGVHGKVKLARDTNTGECVAIKIVDKRNRKRQLGHSLRPVEGESEHKVRREIAILKKCVHPHVVRLLEVMDDPASRKIYMVLENMKGGELIWKDEDGPRLSIERVKSIFRDVVSGLDYLHYQGIIHRDIKPANLLLTEDQVVKISDFGVSYFNQHLAGKPLSNLPDRQMDRELAETAGTPAFFAPELCSTTCDTDNGEDNISNSNSNGNGNGNGGDDLSNVRITKAIDVWALGVTLYCLLFGKCPFMAATEFELFDAIPVQPLTFPANFADQDCKDLLLGLLTKNPDARMTLDQVKVHPWVISDLAYPIIWWQEADPRQYKTVEVTDDDVNQAVTIMVTNSFLSYILLNSQRKQQRQQRQSKYICTYMHTHTHTHIYIYIYIFLLFFCF
ncbi:hypothetical protein PHYBLDRAFT_119590 [Phycomyces blakesleeanus NRRL 1555(-)]|uniref:non-specific serine/threonine protein kinase n=1 Tax=Phycomyces blakesleeanus (strain ATCC 8743b / DSM 1359 / FGSC 10004 / NBRC 33097 / NRRL 1555) TaxID=763407 RepID=A0A163CW48_PHYB8|nr:hypothetical protein PHYBLDRAFT_119590 [Phycomyces blakesleeanus NRRL 1555(-)]OAD66030.1 hypothetical protein PHYBLDRAFT_119590 [Phycomyces blakesleeanus NRRL 1555(-)]|eukprot:XP_018284070.1 hypothetical protein PHYBLDRAFT_119590 [Phycomyces blakesleeanus NRRL 1555(-)]